MALKKWDLCSAKKVIKFANEYNEKTPLAQATVADSVLYVKTRLSEIGIIKEQNDIFNFLSNPGQYMKKNSQKSTREGESNSAERRQSTSSTESSSKIVKEDSKNIKSVCKEQLIKDVINGKSGTNVSLSHKQKNPGNKDGEKPSSDGIQKSIIVPSNSKTSEIEANKVTLLKALSLKSCRQMKSKQSHEAEPQASTSATADGSCFQLGGQPAIKKRRTCATDDTDNQGDWVDESTRCNIEEIFPQTLEETDTKIDVKSGIDALKNIKKLQKEDNPEDTSALDAVTEKPNTDKKSVKTSLNKNPEMRRRNTRFSSGSDCSKIDNGILNVETQKAAVNAGEPKSGSPNSRQNGKSSKFKQPPDQNLAEVKAASPNKPRTSEEANVCKIPEMTKRNTRSSSSDSPKITHGLPVVDGVYNKTGVNSDSPKLASPSNKNRKTPEPAQTSEVQSAPKRQKPSARDKGNLKGVGINEHVHNTMEEEPAASAQVISCADTNNGEYCVKKTSKEITVNKSVEDLVITSPKKLKISKEEANIRKVPKITQRKTRSFSTDKINNCLVNGKNDKTDVNSDGSLDIGDLSNSPSNKDLNTLQTKHGSGPEERQKSCKTDVTDLAVNFKIKRHTPTSPRKDVSNNSFTEIASIQSSIQQPDNEKVENVSKEKTEKKSHKPNKKDLTDSNCTDTTLTPVANFRIKRPTLSKSTCKEGSNNSLAETPLQPSITKSGIKNVALDTENKSDKTNETYNTDSKSDIDTMTPLPKKAKMSETEPSKIPNTKRRSSRTISNEVSKAEINNNPPKTCPSKMSKQYENTLKLNQVQNSKAIEKTQTRLADGPALQENPPTAKDQETTPEKNIQTGPDNRIDSTEDLQKKCAKPVSSKQNILVDPDEISIDKTCKKPAKSYVNRKASKTNSKMTATSVVRTQTSESTDESLKTGSSTILVQAEVHVPLEVEESLHSNDVATANSTCSITPGVETSFQAITQCVSEHKQFEMAPKIEIKTEIVNNIKKEIKKEKSKQPPSANRKAYLRERKKEHLRKKRLALKMQMVTNPPPPGFTQMERQIQNIATTPGYEPYHIAVRFSHAQRPRFPLMGFPERPPHPRMAARWPQHVVCRGPLTPTPPRPFWGSQITSPQNRNLIYVTPTRRDVSKADEVVPETQPTWFIPPEAAASSATTDPASQISTDYYAPESMETDAAVNGGEPKDVPFQKIKLVTPPPQAPPPCSFDDVLPILDPEISDDTKCLSDPSANVSTIQEACDPTCLSSQSMPSPTTTLTNEETATATISETDTIPSFRGLPGTYYRSPPLSPSMVYPDTPRSAKGTSNSPHTGDNDRISHGAMEKILEILTEVKNMKLELQDKAKSVEERLKLMEERHKSMEERIMQKLGNIQKSVNGVLKLKPSSKDCN